jgi:cytidine deaminase
MVTLVDLTKEDKRLIFKAREIVKKSYVHNKDIVSDVVSIMITQDGAEFHGVDIEKLASGSGVCAETSALTNMILAGKGESKLSLVFALYEYPPKYKKKDYMILPPCGTCRHNLSKFGNPWVIVSKTKKVRLKELYPLPFKG